MDERRDVIVESLTVTTLEPVGTGRGPGTQARVVTAAWLVALVGVAGFAVAGRLAEPEVPNDSTAAVAPAPASSARARFVAAPRADEPKPGPAEMIVLTSPAEGDPTITTSEIIVQGFLRAEAASLRVSVETDWYSVDESTVIPALAFGERPSAGERSGLGEGPGGTRHAQFLVRFGLSEPRLTGPMVVRVVALDRDGHRLAAVFRPFRLGPIERPTLGDDGILGGLVFAGG